MIILVNNKTSSSHLLMLLHHMLNITLVLQKFLFLQFHSLIVIFISLQSFFFFPFRLLLHFNLLLSHEVHYDIQHDHETKERELGNITCIDLITNDVCNFSEKVIFIRIRTLALFANLKIVFKTARHYNSYYHKWSL